MKQQDTIRADLNALSRQRAIQNDIVSYFTGPYDDRAAVLLAHTTLEQHLERAIATHFTIPWEAANITLFRRGLLSNFSPKIEIAFALGVFSKEMKDDLSWINVIRNAFAHASTHIDFQSDPVAAACNQLLIPRLGSHPPGFAAPWPLVTARDKYVGSVASITEWLNTESTRGKPLTLRDEDFNRTYRFNYAWP